jgi:hypothetical protein
MAKDRDVSNKEYKKIIEALEKAGDGDLTTEIQYHLMTQIL